MFVPGSSRLYDIIRNTPMDRPRYDAFLSYRRQEPDSSFARDLLARLEKAGYAVAIDEVDFVPNFPFLQEMERCVRESRFTLAVVSPRYLDSGNCEPSNSSIWPSKPRNGSESPRLTGSARSFVIWRTPKEIRNKIQRCGKGNPVNSPPPFPPNVETPRGASPDRNRRPG